MSLIGALNIGKSALAVQQAAIQVTGNNIANAGNADYTRQTAKHHARRRPADSAGHLRRHRRRPRRVQRQIDEALKARLRGSVSDDEVGRHDAAVARPGRIDLQRALRRRPVDAAQHVLQQLVEPREQAAGRRPAAGRAPERRRGRELVQ